jgi:uncharacterized glyoxalase superfamily protein PhnB
MKLVRDSVEQAGGVLETAIDSMPWGERLFYARDPFGNPICFVDEETLFLGSASERSVTR